jgi:hypothetical protein
MLFRSRSEAMVCPRRIGGDIASPLPQKHGPAVGGFLRVAGAVQAAASWGRPTYKR